jgi:ABC-type Na+ transport system ATPase subunit NatA
MNELKMINKNIAKKQLLRIVGSILGIGFGLVQIAKFMYQKGVTDCQEHISMEFPEEYSAITEKVVAAFEKG